VAYGFIAPKCGHWFGAKVGLRE